MPSLRKVYKTGSVVVINYPEVFRDLCELPVGSTAQLDCYTPKTLLREFGVAELIINQLVLSDEHFVTVPKHVDGGTR